MPGEKRFHVKDVQTNMHSIVTLNFRSEKIVQTVISILTVLYKTIQLYHLRLILALKVPRKKCI